MHNPRIASDEAEQNVIGAVLLDNSRLDETLSILSPSDFYDSRNAEIWRAITQLYTDGQPVDPVTLLPLVNQNFFVYLVELAKNTATAANAGAYARIVADASVRRMAYHAGGELQRYAETEGNAGLVSDKAAQLAAALVRGNDNEMVSVGDLAEPFIRRLIEIESGDISPMGLTTGVKDLDESVMGHHPDQLIIVAARPSMGKTSFVINMACNAAATGAGVYFVSLEMNRDQLQNRIISHLSRVDSLALRGKRELQEHEMDRVYAAVQQVRNLPIMISDEPAQTANRIRAGAKRAATRMPNGLGLVIVDYIQLVQGSGKAGNREQDVSEISRQMKRLSKECKCPVVVLAQLNREVEKRQDKRPMLSDLRESGSLEQDADNVYMLYRDEVYNPDKPEARGIAEVLIRKQRDGELATVFCSTGMSTSRWDSLTVDAVQKYQQLSAPKRYSGSSLA